VAIWCVDPVRGEVHGAWELLSSTTYHLRGGMGWTNGSSKTGCGSWPVRQISLEPDMGESGTARCQAG